MMDLDLSSGSDNSDTELQAEFEQGKLQPGLYQEAAAQRKFVNNKPGLTAKCKDLLGKKLDWLERMDVSVDCDKIDDGDDDSNDDFKRELLFLKQAQAAIKIALPRLHKLQVPTARPDDYLAEMAKSDEHMKKVRQRLVEKSSALERSEKIKKLREAKKYNKQVQREVSKQRQEEKRKMQDSVKKFMKGQKDSLDFLDNSEKPVVAKKGTQAAGKQAKKSNRKRDYKNKKFGYGGQKKRSKYNTSSSTGDFASDFSSKKHAMTPVKLQMMKKNQNKNRPGKARRKKLNSVKKGRR